MHQIEALGRCVGGRAEMNRAGIVDQDIDAAEMRGGLGGGFRDTIFETDVHRQGQGATAGRLDFLSRRINGARKAVMRNFGFGHHGDAGAVLSGAQGDGLADAPTGAGDK